MGGGTMSWNEPPHGHDGSLWLYSKYSLYSALFKSKNGNLKTQKTLLPSHRVHFGKQTARITYTPKIAWRKKTVLFLKAAFNLKSITLKTKDTFCITFIWLITSYHLNLLLWCHWRAPLFLFCLCLLFISFSSSFFSSSFFLLNFYLPTLLPTLTACSCSERTHLSLQCYQKAFLLLEVNITYQFVC